MEAATVPVEKPVSPEWHGKFAALGAYSMLCLIASQHKFGIN